MICFYGLSGNLGVAAVASLTGFSSNDWAGMLLALVHSIASIAQVLLGNLVNRVALKPFFKFIVLCLPISVFGAFPFLPTRQLPTTF